MPKKKSIALQGIESKSQSDTRIRESNLYNAFDALGEDNEESSEQLRVVRKQTKPKNKTNQTNNKVIESTKNEDAKTGKKTINNKDNKPSEHVPELRSVRPARPNEPVLISKTSSQTDFVDEQKPQTQPKKLNMMKVVSSKTKTRSQSPSSEKEVVAKEEDVDVPIEVKTSPLREKKSVDTEDTESVVSIDVSELPQPKKKNLYVAPLVDQEWSQVNGSTNRRKKDRGDRRDKFDKDQKGEPIINEETDSVVEFEYYDPTVKLPGDDMKLNSSWTVWIHENDNQKWDLASYESIFHISSIGDMSRFLSIFDNLNKNVRQYFIMRDGITPIWEDNNNKHGAICSIMIDNTSKNGRGNRNGKYDLGVDAFTAMCILVMNESFVKNNGDINGLCYSIKSRSVLIKLWVKDFKLNEKFETKLPYTFLKTLETLITSMDSRSGGYQRSNNRSLISVQTKPIKPNY